MRSFRQLLVWQKAHAFTLEVYRATEPIPQSERYGLTSQLRRSAAGTAANIAEGCGRESEADFARFLHMASGSSSESEYHLLLAKDLGYVAPEKHLLLEAMNAEVKRMLSGLIGKIRHDAPNAESRRLPPPKADS